MQRESKPRCPFVAAPFPDCYVADLSSEDVEKAIFYCGGEFECCEIYAERMKMEREEKVNAAKTVGCLNMPGLSPVNLNINK